MKQWIAIAALASAVLLAGCGDSKIDARQLDENDGLVYKHGDTNPWTGTVAFKDSMPQVVVDFWINHAVFVTHMQAQSAITGCTVHYVKGLPEGDVVCTGLTGKQTLAYRIRDERPDGEAEIDNPRNGDRVADIHLSAGLLEGRSRHWSLDGTKTEDVTLAAGKVVDGLVDAGNGSTVHYKDGKLDGLATYYDQYSKDPISEGHYVDGVRDGKWVDVGSRAGLALGLIRESQPMPALPENYTWRSYRLVSHWDNGAPRGEVQGFDQQGQVLMDWTLTDAGLDGDYMDMPDGWSAPRKLVYKENRLVSGDVAPATAAQAPVPAAPAPALQPFGPTSMSPPLSSSAPGRGSVNDPVAAQAQRQAMAQAIPASNLAQPVPASSSAPDTGLSPCVAAWIAAFRKEKGDDVVVTQDQLDEWQQWCSQGRQAPTSP